MPCADETNIICCKCFYPNPNKAPEADDATDYPTPSNLPTEWEETVAWR